MNFLLIAIIGYFAGSIPFSFIIPWIIGVDIRKIGSGNVGGTNVLRSLGGIWGSICMVLDGAKAFVPIMIGIHVFGMNFTQGLMMGFFAAIGHSYPIWLKFKGGKAVAVTVGTISAVKAPLVALFFAIWIPLAILTKYVSLSSLVSLGTLSVAFFIFSGVNEGLWVLAFLALSAYRHRNNIKRLIKKNENKTDLIEAFKKHRENGKK
ncbi:MAG: glycerol-3-phosphate 1-O-acyltransferase PlsY [Thermotogota bacterium]|nr:glycerol-3-phosphate 1-O-acyltransferase PlsY [Thermotogota bacterium]